MSTTVRAALWMLGAIFSFSCMAVAGRLLAERHDTFEIMMYRSAFGAVIVIAVAWATGAWRQISRQQLGLHFVRNLAHFTGQNLWFYALTIIPLAQLFALEFTSPLWVILLAPLVLGEKLTRLRALAAAMGFVGILIVVRPNIDALNSGVFTAAGSAIFFALSIMLTKRLTRKQSITSILFYLTTMQLVFGMIAAGYDGHVVWPNAWSLPYLVGVGAAGLLAHYCLTNALAIAPATVVAPIDFLRLPAIAVVGMLLFGEALDVWVFVGAAVIFAANYINIWRETRVTTPDLTKL
ncbi:EamA family transporter [Sulfitobacter sp. SK012]|uniref:DMT family transporter n=1 Tax=Sulfitobacter sp. SK012 TaxID=1389005 RepID=UPI000E0AE9EF|nr:DMT family transporter [Sulfitobacter sp. SK012]AXI46810.1 EamA family transporter [Sulfitobacter sp. SK012]